MLYAIIIKFQLLQLNKNTGKKKQCNEQKKKKSIIKDF